MKSPLARITAFIALALLLGGCGPANSLYALYDSDDAVSEDHLLGSWQPVVTDPHDLEKDERWIFAASKNHKFYAFRGGTIGEKGAYVAQARLVRLGNNLFIDFAGESEEETTKDSVIPFPMIATHMIGRVWLAKDTMQIHFLNEDWVKKQAEAGAFSLPHLNVDGSQIITAQTVDLRKFIEAHADDKEALSVNYDFVRAK
jgi:hypothetical protein